VGSAEAKHELPKPWTPTFPPAKSAQPAAPPRALTEPPPLPEPPERGSKSTIEESVVVDEALGATTSPKADLTEVVVPLKRGSETQLVRRTARHSRRRMLYVGGALAIFGSAALAVVLATSAELPKPVVSQHAPIVAPAATPVSPAAVAPNAEIVGEAVASGSPVAPAEKIREVAAPAPAIEAPVNEAPVIAEAPVAQRKQVRVAPAPANPVAHKVIAHPVKKPAKPKYDPDALFFKGN
jgi:hypothetical protein